MRFSILSIGTEINLGLITNTNSKFIAELLTDAGLECNYMLTVMDNMKDIVDALGICCRHSDIVIISGGLGPTDDDLTREAVAEFLGKKLVKLDALKSSSLRFLKYIKNDQVIKNLERQSYIPEGAAPIKPRIGSASGFIVKYGNGLIFSIPGVPREMEDMFRHDVMPCIKDFTGQKKSSSQPGGSQPVKDIIIKKMVLLSTDISESQMEFSIRDIKPLAKKLSVEIGVTANPGLIKIMLIARSGSEKECDKNLKIVEKNIKKVIGDHIYWKGDGAIGDSIKAAIKKSKKNITICTAESITGGLISSLITDTAGSSQYFLGSVVSYSSFAKQNILGVGADLINRKGAVSRDVCMEMAKKALLLFNADFAISATGIAGPTSPEAGKTIGLVYIGIAGPDGYEEFYEKQFIGTRADIKFRTAQFILNRLRLAILKI